MRIKTVISTNGVTMIFRGGVDLSLCGHTLSIHHAPYVGDNKAFADFHNYGENPGRYSIEIKCED